MTDDGFSPVVFGESGFWRRVGAGAIAVMACLIPRAVRQAANDRKVASRVIALIFMRDVRSVLVRTCTPERGEVRAGEARAYLCYVAPGLTEITPACMRAREPAGPEPSEQMGPARLHHHFSGTNRPAAASITAPSENSVCSSNGRLMS